MKSNVCLLLVLLLAISLVVNYIQFTQGTGAIEVSTDTITVTSYRTDTIYKQITKYFPVEKPVPIFVHDTLFGEVNVKEYHDTIRHEFGTIYRWEWVKGDLLKKDLRLDLTLPTITETVTTTQRITNTVRNPLFFVTGGFRTSSTELAEIKAVPVVGLFGVTEGHRWAAGVEWGFDRQLTMKIAYTIKR